MPHFRSIPASRAAAGFIARGRGRPDKTARGARAARSSLRAPAFRATLVSIDIEIVQSITGVAAEEWDALVGADDPFLEHAFLAALERSETVGAGAGCVPRFVMVREDAAASPGGERGRRRLVGAVPLYLKNNSYGEFIFDWAWANAAHRAAIRYYPKLVAAVPFTPATGRRLLIAPGADEARVLERLVHGARLVAEEERASSIHFLFCTEDEKNALAEHAFVPRLSMQFHWHNRPLRPFESFEDYLSTFRSRNRKQVRKERQIAAAHGLELRTATGPELDTRDWKALSRFYRANVERHMGIAYLTPRFFEILRDDLAHRVVATIAYRHGRPVAGTLNFEKGAHLYGRYWGALEELEMLHFELCYYRLIDRAIERRLTRFEAGAQGEHKLKRGLAPAFTHSAHAIRHPSFAAAIAEYVRAEEEAVREQASYYAALAPFRATGPDAHVGEVPADEHQT